MSRPASRAQASPTPVDLPEHEVAVPSAATGRSRIARWSAARARNPAAYALLVALALEFALFSILKPATFFTEGNAQTIAGTQAVVAVVALAAMVPLVAGQLDLSLGFNVGLCQALGAGLIVKSGLPAGLVTVIVLMVGLLVGLVNGTLVVRFGLNPFVVTLGIGVFLSGVTSWYSNSQIITGAMPKSFLDVGQSNLGPLPVPFVVVIVCCVVLWFLYEYTRWGRMAYAVGGNSRAALLSGVRVGRVIFQSFGLAGLLAGAAGILSVTILGGSSPDVGLNYLLPAFAGAFLGATSVRPGRFNPIGTIIGIYFVAVGIAGIEQLGAQSYTEDIFYGGALVVAVGLSRLVAKRQRAQAHVEE